MLEELAKMIEQGQLEQARQLANRMLEQGEETETFWILNATLYRMEGIAEAEYACIARGLHKCSTNYELYYMLGEYYMGRNVSQAYLCFEQALYLCNNDEDRAVIQEGAKQCRLEKTGKVHPVSIVILSYNIVDILRRCIESIRATMPKDSYEIVVVDNASTDGAREWLQQQNDIVVQYNHDNVGFAKGCNQGICLASSGYDIMLLNNDTILTDGALFWLRMGLYEHDKVGAVGPVTNYAYNGQKIDQECETLEEYIELAKQINVPLL